MVSTSTLMLGSCCVEVAGGLDAIAARHAQVHEYDIRVKVNRERDGFFAVRRGANDFETVNQSEQHAEPFADHPLVVGEEHPDYVGHADTQSSTRNP